MLAGFEQDFPAGLERLAAAEAEAVARDVDQLGIDPARRAVHGHVVDDLDSGIALEPFLPDQFAFMLHRKSTCTGRLDAADTRRAIRRLGCEQRPLRAHRFHFRGSMAATD